MTSARIKGKQAKLTGVNAPTLDAEFYNSLKHLSQDEKILELSEWWEGWYEGLDSQVANDFKRQPSSNDDTAKPAFCQYI